MDLGGASHEFKLFCFFNVDSDILIITAFRQFKMPNQTQINKFTKKENKKKNSMFMFPIIRTITDGILLHHICVRYATIGRLP